MTGRIKSATTFDQLRRGGRVVRSGVLEFRYLLDGGSGPPRVAFAVPRKAGSAVARNRLRRQLREVMRQLSAPRAGVVFPSGDYIIRLRQPTAEVNFARLRHDAEKVLQQVCAPGGSE